MQDAGLPPWICLCAQWSSITKQAQLFRYQEMLLPIVAQFLNRSFAEQLGLGLGEGCHEQSHAGHGPANQLYHPVPDHVLWCFPLREPSVLLQRSPCPTLGGTRGFRSALAIPLSRANQAPQCVHFEAAHLDIVEVRHTGENANILEATVAVKRRVCPGVKAPTLRDWARVVLFRGPWTGYERPGPEEWSRPSPGDTNTRPYPLWGGEAVFGGGGSRPWCPT